MVGCPDRTSLLQNHDEFHFEHPDYEKDYRDLVGDFAKLESKPRIFVCYPPYIAKDGNWGINEPDTKAQIPVVTKVAKDLKLGIIDVHGALDGKDGLIFIVGVLPFVGAFIYLLLGLFPESGGAWWFRRKAGCALIPR